MQKQVTKPSVGGKELHKSEEGSTCESEEQSEKPEEDTKEKLKKAKQQKWNVIKKQLEEQAAEEKQRRDERLAEEEKLYQEKKKIDEEKQRIREETLADLLNLDIGDYQEEDDNVFDEEDEFSSDSDFSLSPVDEADFYAFEKENIGEITREMRGRLSSMSN